MKVGKILRLILLILGIVFWFSSCYGDKNANQSLVFIILTCICFLIYIFLGGKYGRSNT